MCAGGMTLNRLRVRLVCQDCGARMDYHAPKNAIVLFGLYAIPALLVGFVIHERDPYAFESNRRLVALMIILVSCAIALVITIVHGRFQITPNPAKRSGSIQHRGGESDLL